MDRPFRRALLGYRTDDVDRALGDMKAKLDELAQQAPPTVEEHVGRHLGALLVRFADAVEEGEREARAAAEATIAAAEARAAEIEAQAAAMLQDAGRGYDAALAARRVAAAKVEDALAQLNEALASLDAMPAVAAADLVA